MGINSGFKGLIMAFSFINGFFFYPWPFSFIAFFHIILVPFFIVVYMIYVLYAFV